MRMKCKFCFADLEEDVAVCPQCGKDLTQPEEIVEETTQEAVEVSAEPENGEETAAPKKNAKGLKIALAAVSVLVLAVVLAGVIIWSMGLKDTVLRTLGIGLKNDVYYKLSYTTDADKLEQEIDTVVATMGDQKLTSGELQAFYWMGVYDYLDYYGYYLSLRGVDLSTPLDELVYDEKTGMTYQQMLLDQALESWRRYATLVQMSESAGFTLNAEQKAYVDGLSDRVKELAEQNNYTDLEAFIDKEFFPGCSLASYVQYNSVTYRALCYYESLYEGLLPTKDQVEAYYTEHEAEFKENKKSKEDGDYYDVRHILVAIEGEGTKDENGVTVYTEDQWEACRAKAQKMLDDFLAGEATEEAFATLAQKNSADPGSASNGGLYSKLTKNYGFIKDFENWYLEEGRKPGDTGLVKNTESSVQGYHIMYFCSSTPIWSYEAESMYISDNTSKMLEDAQEKWPMEVNYKKIMLGEMNLTAG